MQNNLIIVPVTLIMPRNLETKRTYRIFFVIFFCSMILRKIIRKGFIAGGTYVSLICFNLVAYEQKKSLGDFYRQHL